VNPLNERTNALRSKLLKRYYKSAALGWFRPRTLHWAKIVDSEEQWRWIRADRGIRGRLQRQPPVHLYQTVNMFKRGHDTRGFYLGGSLLFDADILDSDQSFSLWRLMDSVELIPLLQEYLMDRGNYDLQSVIFSGFRGIHVMFKPEAGLERPIDLGQSVESQRSFQSLRLEKEQLARSIGMWVEGWDWKVSADMWRVTRVPWSLHGRSALRAINLKPPYSPKNFRDQIQNASPFTFSRSLRVRIKRPVSIFTFIDGETYGPYPKGWATKLPIAVAMHLIWQDKAKPREEGPSAPGRWFNRGWQSLFGNQMNTEVRGIKPRGGLAA
jgi:hypothetical protein